MYNFTVNAVLFQRCKTFRDIHTLLFTMKLVHSGRLFNKHKIYNKYNRQFYVNLKCI